MVSIHEGPNGDRLGTKCQASLEEARWLLTVVTPLARPAGEVSTGISFKGGSAAVTLTKVDQSEGAVFAGTTCQRSVVSALPTEARMLSCLVPRALGKSYNDISQP